MSASTLALIIGSAESIEHQSRAERSGGQQLSLFSRRLGPGSEKPVWLYTERKSHVAQARASRRDPVAIQWWI